VRSSAGTSHFARAAVLTAGLLALFGCSSAPNLGEATADDLYEIGVAAAEREDYLLAIEAFRRVTSDSPLNEFADDALIGLADAHTAIGEFASAELEYRTVMEDYPRSPLVPEAAYKLGVAFQEQSLPATLDQSMTHQAIEQFERVLSLYPDSAVADAARERVLELHSKLAEKAYESAGLYLKLEDPGAARVYLETVASDYPDTAWARKALLDLARSYASEGATGMAEETYRRLIESHPGTEEAEQAAAELATP